MIQGERENDSFHSHHARNMEKDFLIRQALDVLESLGVETFGVCRRSSWNATYDVLERENITLPICEGKFGKVEGFHLRRLSTFQASNSSKTATKDEELFLTENILGVVVSVGFVAIVAGLFLGLLTLDALDLKIIQRVSINEQERKNAARLFPIVNDRHRLLVTLLILNALGYECLPIFLDRIVPTWAAVVLSTTLVLLFGEILPSAVFTGPKQLALGSLMVPLVKLFLFVLFPIAAPVASLLDRIVYGESDQTRVHEEMTTYDRAELTALVRIQHEERIARKQRIVPTSPGSRERHDKRANWSALKREIVEKCKEREEYIAKSYSYDDHDPADYEVPVQQLNPPLHSLEVDLVTGALQMKTRLVMDVYTPLRLVYSIPDVLTLDKLAITDIYSKGYSRIPVYRRNPNDPTDPSAVLGFFMTRQLMLIDWDDHRLVSTLPLMRPETVSPRMNLVDLLQQLRVGGSLMAFVCAGPEIANRALRMERPVPPEAGFMGIVTLEDVIESILQDRIHDETDARDRDRAIATLHRWAATKLQKFVRKKRGGRRMSGNEKSTDTTPLLQSQTQVYS
jgi:metal transporter CNNM